MVAISNFYKMTKTQRSYYTFVIPSIQLGFPGIISTEKVEVWLPKSPWTLKLTQILKSYSTAVV